MGNLILFEVAVLSYSCRQEEVFESINLCLFEAAGTLVEFKVYPVYIEPEL